MNNKDNLLDNHKKLRDELILYIKKKFYTRPNIIAMADEIVNQAFLDVIKSPSFTLDNYNFGYMSVACIRVAYKVFHKNDQEKNIFLSFDLTAPLINENNFVEEIVNAEDTEFIVKSLLTLKQIEQIVIRERYYGELSFREISERHNINLNTILSHHRRALEKLRPIISSYFGFGE